MFGIPKHQAEPVGPFEFGHSIRIERPAPEVYALLDWADPRNAKRALGNRVAQVASAPDRFRLTLDLMPGHRFEMIVTEAVPGRAYAFANEITPPVGRLASSHETYAIEPLDAGSCHVKLMVSAAFAGGLSEEELATEVMMMTVSCGNALEKLRIQAEQGAEAVHRIEAMQVP